MTTNWSILLWTIAATLLLWLVQRQLHRHIQGLVLLLTGNDNLAVLVHFMLLLPGVVVHELSHWVAAKLLGLRTGPISLGPVRKRGKQMRFGSVQITRADPVRESLIGLAPLISGTVLVLALAGWCLDLLPTQGLPLSAWPGRLVAGLQASDAWLWVYLIFAISNSMLPSASDRRPWRLFALYLGLVLLLAYLLLGIPRGSEVWLGWGLRLLFYLAYAFSLTTVIDLAVVAIILGFEWLAGLLTGRRIDYR